MSAFSALCHADRVELLTDGAVYLPDGTLVDMKRKVWTSPAAPLAVTGRGDTGAVEAFASAILLLAFDGSFDAAICRLGEQLERWQGFLLPEDVEIVVCGISEAHGPRIFYFVTGTHPQAERKPWALYDEGEELTGGVGDVTAEDIGIDPSNPNLTLAGIGVRLFEAMRSAPGPNPFKPNLPAIHGVGGHIDLTVVTAAGSTTERLHAWPDVVGEKIEPSRKADEDDWQFRVSGTVFLDQDAA